MVDMGSALAVWAAARALEVEEERGCNIFDCKRDSRPRDSLQDKGEEAGGWVEGWLGERQGVALQGEVQGSSPVADTGRDMEQLVPGKRWQTTADTSEDTAVQPALLVLEEQA